jgi:SET domain-containing protein
MASRIIRFPDPDYLYTKKSQIKGAGLGLFTKKDIQRDEVIVRFHGELLTERQVTIRLNKGEDSYFVETNDDTIMDSRKVPGFAKYANDAVGLGPTGFKNNALITFDDDDNVCLTALRKIKAGEEIFTAYGKEYWDNYKRKLKEAKAKRPKAAKKKTSKKKVAKKK